MKHEKNARHSKYESEMKQTPIYVQSCQTQGKHL